MNKELIYTKLHVGGLSSGLNGTVLPSRARERPMMCDEPDGIAHKNTIRSLSSRMSHEDIIILVYYDYSTTLLLVFVQGKRVEGWSMAICYSVLHVSCHLKVCFSL